MKRKNRNIPKNKNKINLRLLTFLLQIPKSYDIMTQKRKEVYLFDLKY